MGRKRKNTNYFNEETEQAVRDYILSENESERNRIFNKHLYIPLKKIAEVYCNTISLDYVNEEKEDLINDCVAHLITKVVSKFDVNSTSKAYSYFSVSAKYFFMQLNIRAYNKAKKNNLPIDILIETEDESIDNASYNKLFITKYYAFIDWMKLHLPNLYYSKKVKQSMWNVLSFLEEFDEVDSYLRIRVFDKFRERFPDSAPDNIVRFGRVALYHQWLHFSKEWDEGVYNPKPLPPASSRNSSSHYAFSDIRVKKKVLN